MNSIEKEKLTLDYLKSIAVSLKGIKNELIEIKENLATEEELDEDFDEEVEEGDQEEPGEDEAVENVRNPEN